ncbi:hypothetical protein QTP86_007662 [Hemibagrus guttatus]|nr:hypothetical protein QTP86_007662 [Hemibagrus guttatus]
MTRTLGMDQNISGNTTSTSRESMNLSPYSPEATAAFATAITLMILFTIVGNILVIIAVLTSRSLRGPQNLFLVSLAAADILVATLIIPFSLANELMGYWYFRSVWCEIYLALDVLFCTSSIVHLCAISLDRYMSISRAVTYGAQRTPRRIKCAILVVWLISAVISFPPLLSMNKNQGDSSSSVGPQCQLNNERWYILYSTIGSFFAPCLIMILVYMRIYQIAKQRTRCPPGEPRKEIPAGAATPKDRALQNGRGDGTTQTNPTTPRPPTLTVPQAEGTNRPASPNTLHPPLSPSKEMTPSTPTPSAVQSTSLSPSNTFMQKQDKPKQTKKEKRNEKKPDNNNGESSSSDSDTEHGGAGVEIPVTPGAELDTGIHSPATVQNLQAVCPKTCELPKPVFTFFFWIGYCNSCLNPVIYTIFNKDFRRAFKRILCKNTKVFHENQALLMWGPNISQTSLSVLIPSTLVKKSAEPNSYELDPGSDKERGDERKRKEEEREALNAFIESQRKVAPSRANGAEGVTKGGT